MRVCMFTYKSIYIHVWRYICVNVYKHMCLYVNIYLDIKIFPTCINGLWISKYTPFQGIYPLSFISITSFTLRVCSWIWTHILFRHINLFPLSLHLHLYSYQSISIISTFTYILRAYESEHIYPVIPCPYTQHIYYFCIHVHK